MRYLLLWKNNKRFYQSGDY